MAQKMISECDFCGKTIDSGDKERVSISGNGLYSGVRVFVGKVEINDRYYFDFCSLECLADYLRTRLKGGDHD